MHTILLNQACARFVKIALSANVCMRVCLCVCMCVCVCVCPPPRLLITIGAMWYDIDPYNWLNNSMAFV